MDLFPILRTCVFVIVARVFSDASLANCIDSMIARAESTL